MMQELEILEARFESFLNRTILGASMNCYNKQRKYECRELQIIDNEDYEEYLKPYLSEEDIGFSSVFEGFEDNYVLNCGVESLSGNEKTVVFLYFKKHYTTSEISKIMNIREQSVSRIKKRALDKLKMFTKGYDLNGK